MTQLDEAIARYHRILESEPYRDLRWVKNLQEQMEARQLSAGGRLLCPFLRPNFVTQKQYDNLVKTGEALISAVDRMLRLALASPQLLSRMQLFPAEKMLAAIDPGYEMSEVSAQLDLQIQNGSLHVLQYNADALTGAAWSEGLSDLFYDCPPVKEFRRRYNADAHGRQEAVPERAAQGLQDVRAAAKKPNIAHSGIPRSDRPQRVRDLPRLFPRGRLSRPRLVSPDQLEYRNGVLRSGNFEYRSDLPPHQRAGVPAALHAEPSAGAGLSRSQGLRREQFPLRAFAQEGDVRAADRRSR